MAEITGFEGLFKSLSKLQDNIKGAIALKAMDAATRRVKASAKQLCPVDQGRLRNSIQYKVARVGDDTIGLVYTNVNYAAFVEYGTGMRGAGTAIEPEDGSLSFRADWKGQNAQPYMYAALRQNKDNIERIIANEIKKYVGD